MGKKRKKGAGGAAVGPGLGSSTMRSKVGLLKMQIDSLGQQHI